ncbi:MAG: hypothetical protein AAGA48_24170 [Myxococcota bacterium]
MSKTIDDPMPVPLPFAQTPDGVPSEYSSLDAPPPPFQLGAPKPQPAGLRKPSWESRESVRRRSPRRARIQPAEVKLPASEAEVFSTDAEPESPLRPARIAEGQTNPGIVLAVVVSLTVSVLVFGLTVYAP